MKKRFLVNLLFSKILFYFFFIKLPLINNKAKNQHLNAQSRPLFDKNYNISI